MKPLCILITGMFFTFLAQAQVTKTVELTAGNLKAMLTTEELETVTNLTITGTMDARDFKTIREITRMAVLDLSRVTINAYSGPGGTSDLLTDYPSNALPIYSFSHRWKLTSILLPPTLEVVGPFAFYDCSALESIDLPKSVTSIGEHAFSYCKQLKSFEFPPLVTVIEPGLFPFCTSLASVKMPPSLKAIKYDSFIGCSSLTSITIPKSVTTIGVYAFVGCGLRSIYCYPVHPVDLWLNNRNNVNVSKAFGLSESSCILYVPFGTRELYANSYEWKDFKNIVEMPGLTLLETNISLKAELGSKATAQIASSIPWTASSNQAWLTVDPSSGNDRNIITFTANASNQGIGRTATVTVNADTISQTIAVFQEGLPKTINLTPGTLSTLLTADEMTNIHHLTLTGEIDARDFKTMRDEMAYLSVIDISGATINAYSGDGGTLEGLTGYKANDVPPYAFFNNETSLGKVSLTSIQLPLSATTINNSAFYGCTGLTAIAIPTSVTSIGSDVFSNCLNLNTIDIPPTVNAIGSSAFFNCTALSSIEIPREVSFLSPNLFGGSGLTSIVLPPSVIAVGEGAFAFCTKLSSFTFPSSVIAINNGVLNGCPDLKSIYVYHRNPLRYGDDMDNGFYVFNTVNKHTCILYVPYGTRKHYQTVGPWWLFENIVEMAEFNISDAWVSLEAGQGSQTKVHLTVNGPWTVNIDQPWLTADPVSGSGNQTVIFTADANATNTSRAALATVSLADTLSQAVNVIQKGPSLTIETAGTLASVITGARMNETALTITGQIDARDFKFIRDKMPTLHVLDLSGATISAYSGKEGTNFALIWGPNGSHDTISNLFDYPANEIPPMAFNSGSRPIASVVLPPSITSIGEYAFSDCYNLAKLVIPPSVTSIGAHAFRGCSNLISVILPPSITHLADYLFANSGLTSISIPSSVTSLGEYVFYACQSLTELDLPPSVTSIGIRAFQRCNNLTSVILPPSITHLAEYLFANSGLTSISIPSSVTSIGENAFSSTAKLNSVYTYWKDPHIVVSDFIYLFGYESHDNMTLYVPFGLKERYAATKPWQEFYNIIEMPGFNVHSTLATIEAKQGSSTWIGLSANVAWTATSNQPWLTVSPSSGNRDQTLLFTVQANTAVTARKAKVTVSAPGIDSKTITITQQAFTTGVAQMAQNRPLINCYPNPFKWNITIDIQNPTKEKITVDIYNLSGQRVKKLTIGNKAESITLSWNGSNERGQEVSEGIYIMKVNEMTRQVVKGF